MDRKPDWRPGRLSEYVGQKGLIKQLVVEIKAARRDHRPMRHALFSGPGGLGKDTIANVIAQELGVPKPRMLYGAELTHKTLVEALMELDSPGYSCSGSSTGGGFLIDPKSAVFPILVINECQNMKHGLMELMHPVLEPDSNGRLVIKLPPEMQTPKTTDVWIVRHTQIWLTNFIGNLTEKSRATVSRFPIKHQFKSYDDTEMSQILHQFGSKIGLKFDADAAALFASRAYGVPRQVINNAVRISDWLEPGQNHVTMKVANDVLDLLGYNQDGWTEPMVDYIKALERGGGRMSIQTLASVLDTEVKDLEISIEPGLLKGGLITKSSSGRMLTMEGRTAVPDGQRKSLLSQRAV